MVSATRSSPSRGIPPFALRPPTHPTSPPQTNSSLPSTSYRQPQHSSSTSESVFSTTLHSSSSSSDATEIGESYVHFGGNPDTTDPFSRFWGMLENMLDEVSNPVKFASAPLDDLALGVGVGKGDGDGVAVRRKSKSKGKDKDRVREDGSGRAGNGKERGE